MIPLKDLNPSRTTPYVTIALLVINVMVFFYQSTLPSGAAHALILVNATVPMRIPQFLAGHLAAKAAFSPLFFSMFFHGGLMHLLGNMLFLWIFGDNVEDYFGHLGYLLFYLVCGVGSGLIHVLFNWGSAVPAIGASGAISGVMGAYILLYPRARVLTLFFIFLVPIPAFLILGYWFAIQFFEGLAGIGDTVSPSGVAWWAHIGGFLLGMAITAVAQRK